MVIGLFQGMFEGNILTFNPGWDQAAQTVDPFTDIRELQREFRRGVIDQAADESSDWPGELLPGRPGRQQDPPSTSTADITVSGDLLACGRGRLHNRDE